MSKVFLWIRDLVLFLICFLAVNAMIPSEKYGRYIRFFGGMVLILLVMEPVASYLNLDGPMEQAFCLIRFQNDSRELSREILGMEKKRKEQMFEAYEQEIGDHIMEMAAQQGIRLLETQVVLEAGEESEKYGQLKAVSLLLAEEEGENGKQPGETEIHIEVEPVKTVEPVEVSEPSEDPELVKAAAGGKVVRAVSSELERFARKVEEYYGLESGKVEIQFQIP